MPTWLSTTWNFIVQTLLAELIVVIVGVLIVQKAQKWFDKKRYGGWCVIVLREGKTILKRKISYTKLKEIQEEPAELSVYLKGVVSPYAWVGIDIIEDGEELDLVHIDREKRTYTVDLDKNPQRPSPSLDSLTEKFAKDVMKLIEQQKN